MIHMDTFTYQRGNPFTPTIECPDCSYNFKRFLLERGYTTPEWLDKCPSCGCEQVPF